MQNPSVHKGPLCTRDSLTSNLRDAGLCAGDIILLHSSLSSLGWVCGGAETVVGSILDVLGPQGTLVVPTHTSQNSDPSHWENPPVPEEWWQTIREYTPAFDRHLTRSQGMGVIPEVVRAWPGSVRSGHPQTSFAAIGPNANFITANHEFNSLLGEESPLARLEEVDSKVLLLGAGYDKCTAFHLAEYRLPGGKSAPNSFAALVDGQREWMTVEHTNVDNDGFGQLGAEFEVQRCVVRSKVGGAECSLFSLREAVAFAQEWLGKHRELHGQS